MFLRSRYVRLWHSFPSWNKKHVKYESINITIWTSRCVSAHRAPGVPAEERPTTALRDWPVLWRGVSRPQRTQEHEAHNSPCRKISHTQHFYHWKVTRNTYMATRGHRRPHIHNTCAPLLVSWRAGGAPVCRGTVAAIAPGAGRRGARRSRRRCTGGEARRLGGRLSDVSSTPLLSEGVSLTFCRHNASKTGLSVVEMKSWIRLYIWYSIDGGFHECKAVMTIISII